MRRWMTLALLALTTASALGCEAATERRARRDVARAFDDHELNRSRSFSYTLTIERSQGGDLIEEGVMTFGDYECDLVDSDFRTKEVRSVSCTDEWKNLSRPAALVELVPNQEAFFYVQFDDDTVEVEEVFMILSWDNFNDAQTYEETGSISCDSIILHGASDFSSDYAAEYVDECNVDEVFLERHAVERATLTVRELMP